MEKIVSAKEMNNKLASARNGKTVVFTNGCFDMLHPGHITCLERACELGDLLIVGINSDDSVRRLKGPDRPVFNEYARARMVAALACVDGVIIYSEDSPVNLIKQIKPDIHVKGSDYLEKPMPEREVVKAYGGEVVLIELDGEWSTSGLLKRMR